STPTIEVTRDAGRTVAATVRRDTTIAAIRGGVDIPNSKGIKYLSRYSGTDRTAVADSVTSVQAAIDALAGTYKIVVDGTFKCSEPLNLPANCWLEAARPGVDGFTFTWQAASDG